MSWLRVVSVWLLTAGWVGAADWPQWLGPKRDASTPEKIVPWVGRLKVLWRQPIGEGNAGPVVAAGRIFLHTKVPGKLEEQLTAYDAASGKLLWQEAYPRPPLKTLYGNGPRATPAIDGQRIYTYGITGIVTCFDTENGKQVWQVDATRKFSPRSLVFGASCSPLVLDDVVLINIGGKGASVVAFAKETGEVRWQNLDDGASYSSPITVLQGSTKQVVFLTQEGLVSLAPLDGRLRWRFPFRDLLLESSTTPVHKNGTIIASSITLGSVAVHLETKDGRPAVRKSWQNSSLTCYFGTPVAVGQDHLYAVIGANPLAAAFAKKTKASLRCIDLHTGKELWKKLDVGTYHASLIRTGDDKLLMLEEKGDLVLLEPNPTEYRELARSSICRQTWAHPAIADDRLFVRDGKELVCVSLK